MSTIVKPYTFSAGATIRASEHNNCFDTLLNDFDGNITNINFSATASISDTQLATIATTSKIDFSALTTTNQATGDLLFYSGTNLWTRFARGTANQSLKCQHDSQTVLLLHCDGTDGLTTFTDSSVSVKTVTVNGNAQIDTDQSVFGGASGLFDGIGDYLSLIDSNDWNFGTGNFTIDFRCYLNDITTEQSFYSQGDLSTSTRFQIRVQSGEVGVKIDNTTATANFNTTNSGLTIDSWFHIALVRNGNVFTTYINGIAKGTETNSGSCPDCSNYFYIGASFSTVSGGDSKFINGWMDEIRISKGIARWTTNFTPEISAYSPDLIWVT